MRPLTGSVPLPSGPSTPGDSRRLVPILAVFGILMSIVGWTDVGLFWWPLGLGDPEWEFGIVTQTFQAMPLPTVGLALLALAARIHGGVAPLRLVAGAALLVTLFVAACSILYALDAPLAWRALDNPEIAPALKRSLAKTSLYLVSYLVSYGTVAILLWRGARPTRR